MNKNNINKQNKTPDRKPNILFILADDMGWMDSSIYGSEYYETPNIDRIAKRGMLFTDAYSASPLCSPTRASIMTGKYPARLRITKPSCHREPEPDAPYFADSDEPWRKVIEPRAERFLPLDEYTIGKAFKDAGYTTGFIGKWHLGRDPKFWPHNQGFEFDMGAPDPGPPSYFSPYRLTNISDGPDGEYITDRISNEAVNYIDVNKDKPFLLFLCHFAVHTPFHAKSELVSKYNNKTDPRGKQKFSIMGAMLESMDKNIGIVLDKLDELKIAENTIIIFMSDNGGLTSIRVDGISATNNYPLRNGKGDTHEGGVRVPCIISWPEFTASASECSEVISSIDMYSTMLDMAGIEKKQDHIVDGISLAPLLKGIGEIKREAIFCDFPHYNAISGTKPSSFVRKGDWKLIRYFGEGENGKHDYELFNLKEDIGEKNNIAGNMPELVEELDILLEKHLKDIDAMIPIPNPDYDSSYPMPPKWPKKGDACKSNYTRILIC